MEDAAPPTFEEAFDGCYKAAYRVAFKVLGASSDAEDAAHIGEAVKRETNSGADGAFGAAAVVATALFGR